MSWGVSFFLLVALLLQVFGVAALTNTEDFVALKSLKDVWENVPPNWDGADPCGNNGWDGINCDANNRVVTITLVSFNISGQLSSDIKELSELQILDLSYNRGLTGALPSAIGNLKKLTSLILVGCGFSGPIPPSIGAMQELVYLSLNLNNFVGEIPASIGNLRNLYWLDLADNRLSGSIPVSTGTTPGLDMLFKTNHFHFGNNRLSGEIPSQLFNSNMTLIHLLLEGNQLTGRIPSSLALVQSLEVLRLDRNFLSGPVPNNLNSLTTVQELSLANNRLTGPFPNLTGMNLLHSVDLSNNSFDATEVPSWLLSSTSLTTLIMDNAGIQGQLPVSLFSLPQLQTVELKNNRINGTLNIGPNRSTQLQRIDLQNNFVDGYTERAGYNASVQIVLVGNPICDEGATQSYCTIPPQTNNTTTYQTPPENCTPTSCNSDRIQSPTCRCAYPYSGALYFRAPSFSSYGNATVFESLRQRLMSTFQTHHQPVDSVSLSNPTRNMENYLQLTLQIFPAGQDHFNRTGVSRIGFMMSNQTFKPPPGFGPFYFNADTYPYFAGPNEGSNRPSNMRVIIGAAVGASILLLLLLIAGVYAIRQKRRAETAAKKSDPFASWDSNSNSGAVPQLRGARSFSFEEIKKCTDNFSDNNEVGSGGYGKVYRGTLPNGQLVAIKRTKPGSTQGGVEFKNEIELLSRVHHKNVVSLVGFCFDHGKTGIRLDWTRRLRIAIGAARGIQYLHELANPPIIHRDIKSNNILLDDRLNAKVADFGLSKPMGEPEKGHITTQVKGTMGYLDPEYYMTQELTEKSDVYSFGVLLFELLTSRSPIVNGKYIVREVKEMMDKNKHLYNLEPLLDPIVASNMAPGSVEKFVDLALRCVQELGVSRPTMNEVVKEIENIMELSGLNPHNESASTSSSYEGKMKEHGHPYTYESLSSHNEPYSPSI
ncbi:Leucine-rich repeat protein kinase family protein [Striga hermonthica]|uniref:non-specific serine/threonine protein kinase n=1 Tax=Striga hermonthica TaxID=68872 RepID=A0A9N7NQK3_STRHE|nr:Leucine-rich repeat protein kinase family protein [Striga hermonthica]